MNSLFKQTSIPVGFLALMGLMLTTRIHHFGSAMILPDASLIVFFLSGYFFKSAKLFLALLLEAALVDYLAISQFNVSDWCISPAYVGLIPTYAALWYSGRYGKKFSLNSTKELSALFAILFLATSMAFLISNGTFYLFSGRYNEMAVSLYSEKIAQYYLPYLIATLIYGVVIVAAIKVVQALTQLYLPFKSTH